MTSGLTFDGSTLIVYCLCMILLKICHGPNINSLPQCNRGGRTNDGCSQLYSKGVKTTEFKLQIIVWFSLIFNVCDFRRLYHRSTLIAYNFRTWSRRYRSFAKWTCFYFIGRMCALINKYIYIYISMFIYNIIYIIHNDKLFWLAKSLAKIICCR